MEGGADIDNRADVNQNKTQSKKQTQILKQMKKPPVKDTPTSPPKSKSKKDKVGTAALPPLIKAKGKSYKSSLDRNVTEKDPKSQEVLVKKYVKDTKPGGRSKRGELLESKYYKK